MPDRCGMYKILGYAAGAAAVGGLIYVLRKKNTLEDLSVDLAGVKFDPIKDIKLTGTEIGAVLRIGNPSSGSLNVDIVDLRVQIDGKDVGRIVDYKLNAKINPKSLSNVTVNGVVPTAGVLLVLGKTIINAITAYKSGKGTKEAIYGALPEKALVIGKVRAEGQVFDINQEVPLVQKESEIKLSKDGKVIKEPKK